MRRAANFNPEWGYLAPAPSFVRSARLVIVAAAIGATAGAAVVISLADRPAAEQSVAARTLVQQPIVAASAAAGAPVVAQLQTESQHGQQAQSRTDAPGATARQAAMLAPATVSAAGSIASESASTSTAHRAATALALAESPAVSDALPAPGTNTTVVAAPEPAPAQKAPNKKPRATWRAAPRYDVPRYGQYSMSRYDQRYVQMEREPRGWQRPFGEREY